MTNSRSARHGSTNSKSLTFRVFNSKIVRFLIAVVKFIFAKRTILFVTKKKIRTFNLGWFSQFALIAFFAWVGDVFIQSLRYDALVDSKVQEIEKLKTANSYFQEEFSNINEHLEKVNEYLVTITGKKHVAKATESLDGIGFKKPGNLNEDDLSKKDKHTYHNIKDIENNLGKIKVVAQNRIKKIEQAIELSGLSMKKINVEKLGKNRVKEISLNDKDSPIGGQGGPASDKNSLDFAVKKIFSHRETMERKVESARFSSDLDYLMALENMVEIMPLSRPMKNYYISSGFGSRSDPMTRRMARHEGLDFVGKNKEKIISPASGRVILAGKYSDYGNAIVIDHGFGITTRYGHLSEIKVTQGQKIKQGDIIALQGSTGRSTAAHLHYEVRYKNTPLNPRRFLEAGDYLFNDDTSKNYVNS
jgi:hypothetical protein